MFCGVSPAVMERVASCLKRVRVASDSLREFQPGLVLDDVEDLVNWEVQGVKVTELLAFAVIGKASSLGAKARCPLSVPSSCHVEGSHGHRTGHRLWIASC